MPFLDKCNLCEKIIILEELPVDTFEFFCMKKSINDELVKFSKFNMPVDKYKYYLDEENKLKNIDCFEKPLKYRILDLNISDQNKAVIYNKFKQYETLNENNEQSKLLNWIETAVCLPSCIKPLPIQLSDGNNKISNFLYNVKRKLDCNIYGLDNVKDQILMILNSMITNPSTNGLGMALVGAQGVGKTELAQSLAKAIELPFVSIPLGGLNDSSFLSGHNYTYEGSTSGAIVNSIITMKQLNGIMLFDEIDKLSTSRYGNEVSKLLIHITDSTQNHHFKDKYLGNEISVDLSHMWFIYSLNYIDSLDRTLRDRIPIIYVDGYTKKEKKEIVNKHILKNELHNLGLQHSDIIIDDTALDYLIDKCDEMYTEETKSNTGKSGVRQLKHVILNILMKLNMIKNCIHTDGSFGELKLSYHLPDFKLPFTLTKTHIDKLDVLPKSTSVELSMYA